VCAMPFRERFAQALEIVASSSNGILVDEIGNRCGLSDSEVRALFSAIEPLGFCTYGNGVSDTLYCPSVTAALAAKSYSRFLRSGYPAVEDWGRQGAECISPDEVLKRGASFLMQLEQARSGKGDIEPLHQVMVSKIIFKIGTKEGNRLLMLFDSVSRRYQFVGGKVRGGENFLEAAIREIGEELRESRLVYNANYHLKNLFNGPTSIRMISKKTGALTEYRVQYYYALVQRSFPLPANHRLVSARELHANCADDGYRFTPEWPIMLSIAKKIKDFEHSFRLN
jgi:8-oxo-dGTP pyrophosphatase MutT (NUDIX family)